MDLYEHVLTLLDIHRVPIKELAVLVKNGQKKYIKNFTQEQAENSILHVLKKREVQNAIITGIELDTLASEGKIKDPYLAAILKTDEGQYQVDELLSTACVDIFGGVASSNRGYLDKTKPGIIGEVDARRDSCNVFLDDLLAAIVSSAESYVANKKPAGVYTEFEKTEAVED